MKLSTKTRYGMRAVIEVAARYKNGPVSVSRISKKEGISMPYLEQLLNKLKRHGVVKSIRGARGGYVLAKEPALISLYEIVNILEGGMSLVRCLSDKEDRKRCARMKSCRTRPLWKKMSDSMNNFLRSITLEDLAGSGENDEFLKNLEHNFEYSI